MSVTSIERGEGFSFPINGPFYLIHVSSYPCYYLYFVMYFNEFLFLWVMVYSNWNTIHVIQKLQYDWNIVESGVEHHKPKPCKPILMVA